MDKEKVLGLLLPLIKISVWGLQEECMISKSEYSVDMIQDIIEFSKWESIPHIAADGMKKAGLMNEPHIIPVSDDVMKYRYMAAGKYLKMEADIREICNAFDMMGIPYIKLKGAKLREIYPEPWMRNSCDVDILVSEENLQEAVEKLEEDLSYSVKMQNYHDVSMFSPAGTFLELHFSIKENTDSMDNVLEQVWEFSYPSGEKGSSEYLMTEGFLIFHHIAHMAHHFLEGGCGIRPFIDFQLLRTNMEDGIEEAEVFLKQSGLLEFFEGVKGLTDVWFCGKEHTEVTSIMQKYLLDNDVSEKRINQLAVGMDVGNSEFRNVKSRIFLPADLLKATYPVLRKHEWMLPLCQIHRAAKKISFARIIKIGRNSIIRANIRSSKHDDICEMLKRLGFMRDGH